MIEDIMTQLPAVRGRYSQNTLLSTVTWFRVGGPAEVVFKPSSLQDLSVFLKEKPENIPVHVIGVGSNLLVRDGGLPGVVIRLGKGFTNILVDGDRIEVGAGVLDRNVAMTARDEGIGGLEFLCGIPGTIGGALRMNAGCYGAEIKDVLEYAIAMDPKGNLHRLTAQECGLSYRHSGIPQDWIFVSAGLRGVKANPQDIELKMQEMLKHRETTQPVHTRTGGSTFANPDGYKAWELIDQAGCRGMKVGAAQVSELHCNFLVNTGGASAKDIEQLGELVRQKVKEKFNVDLRWEIQRIGREVDQQKTESEAA
ncbi:MAG: UDP-N-acetylmuramate dehydrogenase [Alphaproteobacteria bacterium]|nr:UDP-N-acetylmuramate dehydrogenase [Alphaproteobacteria bacterium]